MVQGLPARLADDYGAHVAAHMHGAVVVLEHVVVPVLPIAAYRVRAFGLHDAERLVKRAADVIPFPAAPLTLTIARDPSPNALIWASSLPADLSRDLLVRPQLLRGTARAPIGSPYLPNVLDDPLPPIEGPPQVTRKAALRTAMLCRPTL